MSNAVGAVVIDYFAEEELSRCVASLRESGVDDIVVVDNSEVSSSAQWVGDERVRVVNTERNLGYGRGANRGVAFLPSATYLLITNPDVVFHPGAVRALALYLDDHDDVCMVGPRILDEHGNVYPSVRVFPNVLLAAAHSLLAPLWKNNPFTKRYRSPGKNGRVDWLSGAAFLVRADAFQAVGGFDERYFMFAEDMDLCWRLGRRGGTLAVVPEAVVTHLEGHSRARQPVAMLAAHHKSALRFEIQCSRGLRRALVPLAALVLGLRYAVVRLRGLLASK